MKSVLNISQKYHLSHQFHYSQITPKVKNSSYSGQTGGGGEAQEKGGRWLITRVQWGISLEKTSHSLPPHIFLRYALTQSVDVSRKSGTLSRSRLDYFVEKIYIAIVLHGEHLYPCCDRPLHFRKDVPLCKQGRVGEHYKQ